MTSTDSKTHFVPDLERQASKDVLVALDQLKKILRENSQKLDNESFLKDKTQQRQTTSPFIIEQSITENIDPQRSSGEGIRKRRERGNRSRTSTTALRNSKNAEIESKTHEDETNGIIVNDQELPPPPPPNPELLKIEDPIEPKTYGSFILPSQQEEQKLAKRRMRRSNLWKEFSENMKSTDDAEMSFGSLDSTYDPSSFGGRSFGSDTFLGTSPNDNNNSPSTSPSTSSSSTMPSSSSSIRSSNSSNSNSSSVRTSNGSVKPSPGAIVIGPKKKKTTNVLSSSTDSISTNSTPNSDFEISTSLPNSSAIPKEPPSPRLARTRTSAFYDDATAERIPAKNPSRPHSENYSRENPQSQHSSGNGAKSARSTIDTTSIPREDFQIKISSSMNPGGSTTIHRTPSSASLIKSKMKGITDPDTRNRKTTASRFSAMIGLQPLSVPKAIEGLQKFLEKLELLVVESERVQSESQMRLHEMKVEAAKQIRIFKRWHRKILVTCYRNMAQVEVLTLEHVIMKEQKKVEILKQKIADAEAFLEEIQNLKELSHFLSHKYKTITSENMKNTFHATSEIDAHTKFIKRATRAAKQNSANFKRHFNAESKMTSPEQRKRILDELLDHAIDVKDEHEMYDKVQKKFNEFILDQRYKEGQRLHQLTSRLRSLRHNSARKIPPGEIAQYIEDFAEDIVADLGLDPSDDDLLSELVEAAVFPSVLVDLFEHYYTQPADYNDRLNKNRQYLRQLTFQKLPLEMKLPETAEVLLQIRNGVERLNDIVFSLTPRYMIQAVEDTLQLIYEILKKRNNTDVGADDILPVFIYSLIHCQVWDLWKYVDFTSQFLSPRSANGQLGYCAVTFQAAVMFLTQLDLAEAANKH